MTRITRDQYLMNEAFNASQRSTCLRLQVGAVLVRDGRPILAGYNGALAGLPHCIPETCGPDKPCINTVHAEVNCIYFAAKYGIATQGAELWCTDSPCKVCAEAIIQAGIKRVVYRRQYRDTAPIHLLYRARVQVCTISEINGELCAPKL